MNLNWNILFLCVAARQIHACTSPLNGTILTVPFLCHEPAQCYALIPVSPEHKGSAKSFLKNEFTGSVMASSCEHLFAQVSFQSAFQTIRGCISNRMKETELKANNEKMRPHSNTGQAWRGRGSPPHTPGYSQRRKDRRYRGRESKENQLDVRE